MKILGFGLLRVNIAGIGGVNGYNIRGSYGHGKMYLRPIVQIPLSACEITKSTTEGMDFDIKIK